MSAVCCVKKCLRVSSLAADVYLQRGQIQPLFNTACPFLTVPVAKSKYLFKGSFNWVTFCITQGTKQVAFCCSQTLSDENIKKMCSAVACNHSAVRLVENDGPFNA